MNQFTKPDPTIKEFREVFEKLANEITIDGLKMHSHDGSCNVFVCTEDNDDSYYDLVGLDIKMRAGCGCWSDIVIKIKKSEK